MLSGKDFVTSSWHCGLQKQGLVGCMLCFNFLEALPELSYRTNKGLKGVCEPSCKTTKDQKGIQDSAKTTSGTIF